jgi:hypothetical protein
MNRCLSSVASDLDEGPLKYSLKLAGIPGYEYAFLSIVSGTSRLRHLVY